MHGHSDISPFDVFDGTIRGHRRNDSPFDLAAMDRLGSCP